MSKDVGLLLAIVVAVMGPTLPVVGNPENLAAFILLAVLAWSGSSRDKIGLFYVLALVGLLASLSTVAGSVAVKGSYSINPNAFGPFVRMAICFYALRCAADPLALQGRLLWLGAVASAFGVLQYVSPAVAAFTSAHYLGSERSSVFTEDFSGDSIVRIIGFYENPSSVALMSIALILLSLQAYSSRQLGGGTLTLFVMVHVMAGVLSLSKIFFAGLPLLFLQLVILRYRVAAVLAAAALLVAATVFLAIEDPLVDVVRYSLSATLDPEVAFKGRYLDEQEAVLARSRLLGYGVVNTGYVNINDSAYLVTGYLFGVFGSIVLVAYVFWGALRRWRQLPASLYLVVAVILIAGVGANSILGFRIDIFLTSLCTLLCVRRHGRGKDSVLC